MGVADSVTMVIVVGGHEEQVKIGERVAIVDCVQTVEERGVACGCLLCGDDVWCHHCALRCAPGICHVGTYGVGEVMFIGGVDGEV